jgi:HSP20 family protein
MNVVRYEPRYRPLGLLGRLLQEDNLEALYNREPDAASDWLPAVDIHEKADRYLIKADLPGVEAENIEVTMEDGVLSIQGHRALETKEERGSYSRTERVNGNFLRRFTLPDKANGDSIEATTNQGVLEISIARHTKIKARKIEVKSS